MAGKTVAVVGATGAVGTEMLRTLEKRGYPVGRLRLFASKRSAGRRLEFRGEPVEVEELREGVFDGVDVALFSAGGARSQEFAPDAVAAGAVVIDNSSAFRMDPEVPLVVPEVNPQDLRGHNGLIANPNCSTILMVVPLWPLHVRARARKVVVATYQAASGAGARAMRELEEQTRDVLEGRPPRPEAFPHPIAFNLFSHNSEIGPDGYCREERKMIQETRKMFHEPELIVSATTVRVPVPRAHSEAVYVEFEEPIDPREAREILAAAPGVRLVDDPRANRFPMPMEATGGDDVLVGRIRSGLAGERSLAFFLSGDQLLKGAALNAVQIAELLD